MLGLHLTRLTRRQPFRREMAAEKALAEPIVPLPKPWQPSACSRLSHRGSDRDFPADFDDRIHWQSEVLGQVGRVAVHEREQCLCQSRYGFVAFAVHDGLVTDIIGDV